MNYYNNMYPYYYPYYYQVQSPNYSTRNINTNILYHNLRENGQSDFNVLQDYGSNPIVFDIEEAAENNTAFRTTIWTGNHLQVTLMSINPHSNIGLEMHPNTDQFIRIEEGMGYVTIGDTKDNLDFKRNLYEESVVIIPAGKWHNIFNTGSRPLKLYSIYAPAQHPKGTIHQTKDDALASEKH